MPPPSIFLLCLLIRAGIALLTRTFFQPDEFFQCLEPAHKLAFDYGHLTWEWVMAKPIRTLAYPTLWALLYKSLKLAGVDKTELVVIAPKLLSGALAALVDVYLYALTNRVLGSEYASVALFLSLTSFFHSLALTRTLATSMETILSTMAFYYWPLTDTVPLKQLKSRTRIALCVAALSCILRPTSAVMWLFLFCELAFIRRVGVWLIRDAAVIGISAITLSAYVDSFRLTIDGIQQDSFTPTLVNFILVNSSSVSAFYGAMPWHYYLTQALPLLLTVSLPEFAWGFLAAIRSAHPSASTRIAWVIAWTISVYSAIKHKEWRFLHPLLPLMHVLAANYIVRTSQSYHDKASRWIAIRRRHALLAALTVPLTVYVVRYHGYAQIAVTDYLRTSSDPELISVGFLMPCHSTPMHSHIHKEHLRDQMWAIGCEPPLHLTLLDGYKDQSDFFYDSPSGYIRNYFPPNVDPAFPPSPKPTSSPGSRAMLGRPVWNHTWPSHLAFFGSLLQQDPVVSQILGEQGYQAVWETKQFGFEEDPRRRGGVQVWKWTTKASK